MGEIIAVNAQYGDFIKNLDVSEERKEDIINALQNLIMDQNQLRMEILQKMQVNPQMAGRDDLRQKMQAISSPDAQLEALSYDLTESGLNAFNEFQEQRLDAYTRYLRADRPINTGGAASGATLFSGDIMHIGPRQPRAIIQLLPGIPAN